MYTCNNVHVDNLEMDQLPSLQSNINTFGFFPLIRCWYVDQQISQLNPTLYINNSIIGWKIWTLNVSIRNTKKCQLIKLQVMLAFVIQNTRALLGVIFEKTWWIVLMLIFPSLFFFLGCVSNPFSFFLENLNIRLGEEKKKKEDYFHYS